MTLDSLRQEITAFLKFTIAEAPVDFVTHTTALVDGYSRHRISYTSVEGEAIPAYLLLPDGEGPFAAVMPCILYMLIGPKGSGKTHIGTLVQQHTDIVFIRVEPIWLALAPGEDGWQKVEATIDDAFRTHDHVMIESLGAGEAFQNFYHSLATKYTIKMIRVYADLDTCLDRVRTRSNIDHIAVSDEKVAEYNRIAAGVTYDWALEIDNNQPASDEDILYAIRQLRSLAA